MTLWQGAPNQHLSLKDAVCLGQQSPSAGTGKSTLYQTTPGGFCPCILMAAGNKGIEASVLPQHLQYMLEDNTQAGRGLSKAEQLLGRAHYISHCYVEFREVHQLGQHHQQGRVLFHPYLYLVHKQRFDLLLGKFPPSNFHKVQPTLGNLQGHSGTNDANGHKDLYLRREMLAEPHCQFWFLSPAASLAGPGCSSKTCTCTLPPQTNPICIRQKVHWSIKCCHCQSLQQSLTEELTGERLHLLHLLVGSVQAMDRSVVAAAGILPVAMGLKKL